MLCCEIDHTYTLLALERCTVFSGDFFQKYKEKSKSDKYIPLCIHFAHKTHIYKHTTSLITYNLLFGGNSSYIKSHLSIAYVRMCSLCPSCVPRSRILVLLVTSLIDLGTVCLCKLTSINCLLDTYTIHTYTQAETHSNQL